MGQLHAIGVPLLIAIVAAMACSGAAEAPTSSPTPTQLSDPVAAEGWFLRGTAILNTTSQAYQQRVITSDLATGMRDAARVLAADIRAESPSDDLSLRVAEGLDELVMALEFVLEFARNSGYQVGGIEFPSLEEALNELAGDLISLSDELGPESGSSHLTGVAA